MKIGDIVLWDHPECTEIFIGKITYSGLSRFGVRWIISNAGELYTSPFCEKVNLRLLEAKQRKIKC